MQEILVRGVPRKPLASVFLKGRPAAAAFLVRPTVALLLLYWLRMLEQRATAVRVASLVLLNVAWYNRTSS